MVASSTDAMLSRRRPADARSIFASPRLQRLVAVDDRVGGDQRRASPAKVLRTLWITDRSATIAPTPIAMQMKKNSRRCHDARISRAAISRTNSHPRLVARRSRTGRPSQDQPIVGHRAHVRIVRHQHQRHAARSAHLQQQIEHVPAVRAVEIAGRLVGKDQRRIVGQRARNGNALLLAPDSCDG
jgi:hypothetical protein